MTALWPIQRPTIGVVVTVSRPRLLVYAGWQISFTHVAVRSNHSRDLYAEPAHGVLLEWWPPREYICSTRPDEPTDTTFAYSVISTLSHGLPGSLHASMRTW